MGIVRIGVILMKSKGTFIGAAVGTTVGLGVGSVKGLKKGTKIGFVTGVCAGVAGTTTFAIGTKIYKNRIKRKTLKEIKSETKAKAIKKDQ